MTASTATMTGLRQDVSRTPLPGMTRGAVRAWLRLEGLAAFCAGLALFGTSGGNWLFIIPLLLLRDISVAGFAAGSRVGTFTYNLVHNWAPGLVILALAVLFASPGLELVAAILIAHVGMDRAAGYGLKLPNSFKDTHLGRMGRAEA